MWSARSEAVSNGTRFRVLNERDASPVPYADVPGLWQNDPAFRDFFIGLLAAAPYRAFRWETPPITASTAGRPFEFVLLDSPDLVKAPDADAFAAHFRDADAREVIEFPNLGRDARLVVPCPVGADSAYAHLGDFVRRAPASQVHALWARVGQAMERRIGVRPVWLSTAGAGVAWLHVRLDDQPKYYGYAPYRAAPGSSSD